MSTYQVFGEKQLDEVLADSAANAPGNVIVLNPYVPRGGPGSSYGIGKTDTVRASIDVIEDVLLVSDSDAEIHSFGTSQVAINGSEGVVARSRSSVTVWGDGNVVDAYDSARVTVSPRATSWRVSHHDDAVVRHGHRG